MMEEARIQDVDVMKPGVENIPILDTTQRKSPAMSAIQFSLWTALLEERTGMVLPESRISFLETNLSLRMRALGIDSYQEYYDLILSGKNGSVEWDQLVHHLTVHETRFQRHQATQDLICEHVLPQDNKNYLNKPLTLNLWSVSCSTGEEPYSIAMAIDEHLKSISVEYYLGIMASDISRDALAIGRTGIYNKHSLRNIGQEWLDKYFIEHGSGKYQVKPELRQRVCFNKLNVLEIGKAPIGNNMDVIVCQNLLIYYDKNRRKKIVDTMVEHLAPGGMLILGSGEMIQWSHPDVERFNYPNTLAYRHK